jgi:2-polyprenyl-3-methyl-5-hydroxy-6-metoxy-1,4-benzoquinol methylase
MAAIADELFQSAYGDFAAYYDRFTSSHDYDLWISVIEGLARSHGFDADELIDAACGTGKSFLPWARRGFTVRALDRSSQMLAVAQARCAVEDLDVELLVHDLRNPAGLARAPLVTCLDDALNYQLSERDLDALVAGLAGLVALDGLLMFDTNSWWTYTRSYVRSDEVRDGDALMRWRGARVSGELFDASITVHEAGRFVMRSHHCQRYWPRARIERSVAAAGLRLLDVFGMSRDGVVEQPAAEDRHSKFLFVATR